MDSETSNKLRNLSEKDMAALKFLLESKSKPKTGESKKKKVHPNKYVTSTQMITHTYTCTICGLETKQTYAVKVTAKGGKLKKSDVASTIAGCGHCIELITAMSPNELRQFTIDIVRCLRRGDVDFSSFGECIRASNFE